MGIEVHMNGSGDVSIPYVSSCDCAEAGSLNHQARGPMALVCNLLESHGARPSPCKNYHRGNEKNQCIPEGGQTFVGMLVDPASSQRSGTRQLS